MRVPVLYIENSTWELEGDSFYCLHDEGVRVEQVEVDTMRDGEHDTYEVPVAICVDPDCDQEIENYDFTPDYDDERGDEY